MNNVYSLLGINIIFVNEEDLIILWIQPKFYSQDAEKLDFDGGSFSRSNIGFKSTM